VWKRTTGGETEGVEAEEEEFEKEVGKEEDCVHLHRESEARRGKRRYQTARLVV
jgi:hypothetical protein